MRHEVVDVAVLRPRRGRQHLLFCQQYPTGECASGNGGVPSPRDNVSSSFEDGDRSASRGRDCQHQAVGDQDRVDGSTSCEAAINVVTENERKMLSRSGQNGTWSGPGAPNSPGADVAPPAKSGDPTHPGTSTERGKPVVLPTRESDSQEEPMGRRVKDGGGSECRPVTGRIGVEPTGDITPPEREPTSLGSSLTREPRPTDSGEQSRSVTGGNARWCGSRPCARLELHQLEEGLAHGPSAPGAYREGGPGGQVE